MSAIVKPLLKIAKNEFVEFILSPDGLTIDDVKIFLKKNGNFTLENAVKHTLYIPERMIKNKKSIPPELKEQNTDGTFQVNPDKFFVMFV